MERFRDPNGHDLAPPPGLGDHLSALWRGLWLILLCAIVALGAAIAWVARSEPVYRAEMTMVVGYGPAVALPDIRDGAEVLTQTLGELVDSQIVAERVIEDTNIDLDADEVRDGLSVSASPSAAVLDVSYADTDPTRARRILVQVGVEFPQLVAASSVSGPLASTRPVAMVFDPAHVLPDPVGPRPVATAVLAAVAGGAFGAAVVLARASVRRARDRSSWDDRLHRVDGASQRHRQPEPRPERSGRRR